MKQLYQLSLTRQPGRYTDKEWAKELKVREIRNANYRLSHYNYTHPVTVGRAK